MNVRIVSCIMALILMTSFTINTDLKELPDSPHYAAPNYNHLGWDITFNSTSHDDGMVSNTMEIPFQIRTDFVLNVELKPPTGNNSEWDDRVTYFMGLIQINSSESSDEGYINSSRTGSISTNSGLSTWINTTLSGELLEWGRCYILTVRITGESFTKSYVMHPLYIEFGTTSPYDARCPLKDSDGDGFTDEIELTYSTNHLDVYSFPVLPDSDSDGVPDDSDSCVDTEVFFSNLSDHDGDGCWPGEDPDLDNDNVANDDDACDESPLFPANNFSIHDHDGDGCIDFIEDLDSDNDGFSDLVDDYPLDDSRHLNNDDDDDDNDGWTDLSENWFGTDSNNNNSSPDTDGDYWADIHESLIFEAFNQSWILDLVPSDISEIYLNPDNPWYYDADIRPDAAANVILDAIKFQLDSLSNASNNQTITCEAVPCSEFELLQNQFESLNQSLSQILEGCGNGCDEDGDAVLDSTELICNTDPFNPLSRPESYLWITNDTGSISIICNYNPEDEILDSDGDGFSDVVEESCLSDPSNGDSVPNGAWIEFVDGSLVCRTGITTLPESSDESGVDVADITTGIIGGGLITAGATSIFKRWKLRRNKSSKNLGKVLDVASDLDIDFRGGECSIYRNNRSIKRPSLTEETVVYGDSDQYTKHGVIRQSSLSSAGNIDGEMDYE